MPGIITFGEQKDGKLRRPSLEAVSEARRLAAALGTDVGTVVLGAGASGTAGELGTYGADKVYAFDEAGGGYATEVWVRALAQVIAEAKPKVVLIPFTATGKDLAPRLAAKLGAGLVSDCVGLSVKDGRLEARRPTSAGKADATVRWEGEPQLATLRANVFSLGQPDGGHKAEVVKGTVAADARARVTGTHSSGEGKIELTEAQVIV